MNHVWGLFAHPNREMSVIKSENETISHHYTHHVLLMAAVPVICAFIGTTQLGWNFGDGTVIKLSMLTGLALAVLFFWGSSQSLPVVIAINILALVGILSSAFSVVRPADVLAHRLGEPYGSLILSLSVVILEVSLISALMATGDAAPTLMRDTLYSIIMIVTGGLVGFSLLLGGRKFATNI